MTRVAGPRSAVLGLDVGTTSVKAALVLDGRAAHPAEVPLGLVTPRPGWAEQHPDDWWAAVRAAVGSVRAASAADFERIGAIAVTGQMQDLVALDASGVPVRPAILYSDVRAAGEHDELRGRLGSAWSSAIGAEPDATNVAAKWTWLARHEPDAAARAAVVLFGAHSFVVHRLTGGVAACDPTTAATTGFYDLAAGAWWGPIAAATGCPLPALARVTDPAGPLTADVADEFGLPAGIPVVHGPGDAMATTVGLIGADCDRPYAYLGTSGWVAVGTPRPRPAPGVVVLPGIDPSHWVSALPMPTAGAALDWARDALLGGVTPSELDALATDACAATEGVMFLPHLDGARLPRPAPAATGVLVGMRRSTTREVIAAAVIEGLAHAVRQLVELAAPDAPALAVCGGVARSAVVRQVLADVTGREVQLLADEHAALLGAAHGASGLVGHSPRPLETRAVAAPRPERHRGHAEIADAFDDLLPSMASFLTGLVEIRDRADRATR